MKFVVFAKLSASRALDGRSGPVLTMGLAILASPGQSMGHFIGFLAVLSRNDGKCRKNGHFTDFADKIGTYSPCSETKVSRDTSSSNPHPWPLEFAENHENR